MPRRKLQPEPAGPAEVQAGQAIEPPAEAPLPKRAWREWKPKDRPEPPVGPPSKSGRKLYGLALLRHVMQLSDDVDAERVCQDAAEYIMGIWEKRPSVHYWSASGDSVRARYDSRQRQP